MSGVKREACDDWFSKCIRISARWQCEHCGKQFSGPDRGLHCAHIYGRRHKSVRWSFEPRNALSLCAFCHRYFTENPMDFSDYCRNYLGEGQMQLLLEKRNQIFKTTKALRREIGDHYREEYRKAEADPDYEIRGY